jgi:hypothetical protein
MTNPIPKSNLFHTPEDWEQLFAWINSLSGSERVVATTAAMMALNLAHDLVAREKVAV